MKPKQLIIIGGGSSINEGLSKELKEKIKDKFVIGCNYAFNFFDNLTITTYVDREFYKKQHQNIEGLQLIVGQKATDAPKMLNTYFIEGFSTYKRNLKGGIYKANLVGLYSLSLGIFLLDEGEIFLLGFDYGGKGKDKKGRKITHFYQGGINHRGIGKTNYYDMKGRADKDFGVYNKEKKCKIYNVSLNSRINVFPKITYEQFFTLLDDKTYCQKFLKSMIIERIKNV